jgi:DNA-directed RNA polymerase sigma subunit (sigma70/sigma32)
MVECYEDAFKLKDDKELAELVKIKGCNDSLKELINRHTGLCYSIHNKMVGGADPDFESEKDFIIFGAAKHYDPSHNTKFCTYLGNRIKFYCYNALPEKKDGKIIQCDNETKEFLINSVAEETPDEKIISEDDVKFIFECLEQHPDERFKKVIKMRHFLNTEKNTPWWVIAKEIKLSIQGTIDIYKRAMEYVRKKTKTRNFYAN